jgi:hypothetical protein
VVGLVTIKREEEKKNKEMKNKLRKPYLEQAAQHGSREEVVEE